MDGTSDGNDNVLSPTANFKTPNTEPGAKLGKDRPKVHFPPSPILHIAAEGPPPSGTLSFSNPFTGGELEDRRESDSSGASELLRPTAFLRHRDTFARLIDRWSEEDQDDVDAFEGSTFFHRPQLPTHRDTLARLHFKHNSRKALPDHVLYRIAGSLDREDYRSMRLTCRQWAEYLPRPQVSAAQRLPAEIIWQIYKYLTLTEFDAARHTCVSWYVFSLDYKIASWILRSSGSYGAYLKDLEMERQSILHRNLKLDSIEAITPSIAPEQIDEEWLMTKRLATEARLCGLWRGAGLRMHRGHSLSNFVMTETIDFRGVLRPTPVPAREDPSVHHFTVSACGRYVSLTVDKEIFVYNICDADPGVTPIVRIVASRKVLAVSMDTSSGRYAVAALLEGRTGVSWDLKHLPAFGGVPIPSGGPMDLGMRTHVQGLAPLGSCKPVSTHDLSRTDTSLSDPLKSSIAEEGESVSMHGIVSYRTESPETTSP